MSRAASTTHARSLVAGDRAPLAIFGVLIATALPLLLWFGRGGWFGFDEWDLVSQRTAGNLGDLFRPHYQHWLTIPILVFRAGWELFGIRTYFPYQLLSVLVHLAAATLLLIVMRRAGVAAWVSTILAGVFLFFGSGVDNILLGFLIAFTGSLAFGLLHLLLADHEGPIDRRDWLGLIAGLAGMLCSGIAVTMVIVVGLAMLMRRGWRVALLHTVPLGAIYLIWLSIIGRQQSQHLRLEHPTPAEIVRFVAVGLRAAFQGLGQLPGVGLALALVLLIGLPVAFLQLGKDAFRRRAAAPVALLGGAIILLVITGTGRAGHQIIRLSPSGPEYARESRYVYLVAAMTLPALALASDAILRRWQVVGAFILILPILGVPGNLGEFSDFRESYKTMVSVRESILLAPRVPLAAQLPRSVEPDEFHAPGLTLGWLIDGIASGRVPRPNSLAPVKVATATLRLALVRTDLPRAAPCAVRRSAMVRDLEKGQSITVKTKSVTVVYLAPDGAESRRVSFTQILGSAPSVTLLALAGPLRLRIMVPDGVVACG